MRYDERASLPHLVYLLFNAADVAIYVGVTYQLPKRLEVHDRKPWAHEIARVELRDADSRAAALQLERQLHEELRPIYSSLKGTLQGTRAKRHIRRRRKVYQPIDSSDLLHVRHR